MPLFGVCVLRMFYISRLLMTIPSTRSSMQACIETVKESARLLYMLLFFATLALLINSSLLYYVERGTYHGGSKVRRPLHCNLGRVLGAAATHVPDTATLLMRMWQRSRVDLCAAHRPSDVMSPAQCMARSPLARAACMRPPT